MIYIRYEVKQQIELFELETNQAKCNGNTINDIGHEETNKQTKELLMPEKLEWKAYGTKSW